MRRPKSYPARIRKDNTRLSKNNHWAKITNRSRRCWRNITDISFFYRSTFQRLVEPTARVKPARSTPNTKSHNTRLARLVHLHDEKEDEDELAYPIPAKRSRTLANRNKKQD